MEKRHRTKRNGYSKVNNPLENEWMLHKNTRYIYTKPATNTDQELQAKYRQRNRREVNEENWNKETAI